MLPPRPPRIVANPPHLKRGGHGHYVTKLQVLLNARVVPCPHLKSDGVFGRRTEAAVRVFQRARILEVDGVVGPKTWAHLMGGVKVVPPPLPVKGLEPPAATPSTPALTVWEWPLSAKMAAVVDRVPRRFSGELAREFRATIQPKALATTLVLVALFSLLSGGVALVVGVLAIGQDVALALASAVQIASMATCERDLDEAADQLAHVVITLGIGAFGGAIARIASRIEGLVRTKGSLPIDPTPPGPPPTAAVEAPPRAVPAPPPANPTLTRLRGLPRGDLLREVRKATGDREIALWEQVGYGDMYSPVRAGREAAAQLGVRPGDVIGYRLPESVAHAPMGSAIGDLMHAEPQNVSPYGDPFR